jgi:hypothetical protein
MIYKESNKQTVLSQHITTETGKVSFSPTIAGQYRICVVYYGTYEGDFEIGLKIQSDNMHEPSISNALKTEDIIPLNKRVLDILSESKNIINLQTEELQNEDDIAIYQMKISRTYLALSVIQIIIILSIGIYQIYNFRKFLSVNRII